MLDPVPLDTLKPISMRGHGLKTVTEHWQGHGLKTMTESPLPPVVGVKAHHPQRSLASVKGSEAVSVGIYGRFEPLNWRSPSRSVLMSMGEAALPRGRHGLRCESLVSQPQLPGPAYRGSWSYPYQRGLENPSAVRNTRIHEHYMVTRVGLMRRTDRLMLYQPQKSTFVRQYQVLHSLSEIARKRDSAARVAPTATAAVDVDSSGTPDCNSVNLNCRNDSSVIYSNVRTDCKSPDSERNSLFSRLARARQTESPRHDPTASSRGGFKPTSLNAIRPHVNTVQTSIRPPGTQQQPLTLGKSDPAHPRFTARARQGEQATNCGPAVTASDGDLHAVSNAIEGRKPTANISMPQRGDPKRTDCMHAEGYHPTIARNVGGNQQPAHSSDQTTGKVSAVGDGYKPHRTAAGQRTARSVTLCTVAEPPVKQPLAVARDEAQPACMTLGELNINPSATNVDGFETLAIENVPSTKYHRMGSIVTQSTHMTRTAHLPCKHESQLPWDAPIEVGGMHACKVATKPDSDATDDPAEQTEAARCILEACSGARKSEASCTGVHSTHDAACSMHAHESNSEAMHATSETASTAASSPAGWQLESATAESTIAQALETPSGSGARASRHLKALRHHATLPCHTLTSSGGMHATALGMVQRTPVKVKIVPLIDKV